MEKEYIKAVYYLPAYLIYMQSTPCEMPGWMKHKLESKLLGEISITSDMQMIPPYGRRRRGTKKSKEESEKADLKLNIHKRKIMASCLITTWQIDGEQWKQWQTLFSWAPKSLQMETEVMRLKDAYSLEKEL